MAKILVAEDREGMLLLLTKNLESKGHLVEGVLDGQEAIEKIREKKYDIVITDLRMPGADGMEVLEEARKIDPQALVIMITAYGTMDIAVEAMKKGAFDFIAKPFSINEVDVKVEKALEQKRLIKEKNQLSEVNQALQRLQAKRTEFFSIITHELRNPLTAVKTGVGFVLDERPGKINTEQRGYLETAYQSIKSVEYFINRLSELTKIESTQMERKDFITFNLSRIAKNVSRELSPAFKEKDLDFQLSLPEEEVTVYGNPRKIKDVCNNLLINAIRFTSPRGKIHMTVENREKDLLIKVQDTGCGIVPDAQVKIFDKYYQVKPDKRMGAGLGLAICKAIIEQHEGKIWVKSKVDEGSIFYVSLPAEG